MTRQVAHDAFATSPQIPLLRSTLQAERRQIRGPKSLLMVGLPSRKNDKAAQALARLQASTESLLL